MSRPRILLAEPFDSETEDRLAAGADVVRPASTAEADLAAAVRDCEGLLARSTTRVSAGVIAAGRRLRVIGVAAIGTDNIDEAAAAERSIPVLTSLAALDAVAEFTVALVLGLLRPAPQLAQAYARGEFSAARRSPHGVELCDLTIGILGMGRIGSRVGRICAAGFRARVIYTDIGQVGPFAFAAEAVPQSTLLEQADVVSLHVPLTGLTRGLVNAVFLNALRPGARLVNTARGAVVDTEALVAALDSGHLAGAALDVTEPEPLPAGHALFSMPQVILTPHVASRTQRGLSGMFSVADDVLEFLARS